MAAEPRLLVWLRERTVLTGSEYTENIIYIHLKLIFAFAARSSLSKVRNDSCSHARDVRRVHTYVATRHGSIRAAYTNQFQEPVIPVPYLVARLAPFVQLHIDDAILCIMNDVMIVLY